MATPSRQSFFRSTPIYRWLVTIGLIICLLIGIFLWNVLPSAITAQDHPTSTAISNTTPISPLIFGTNLSLFQANDQVLNSRQARLRLRQLHLQIIRMPVRPNLPSQVTFRAAQAIKEIGASPLVILHGAIDQSALRDDQQIISIFNQVFGKSRVYYELGNENDLQGVSADRYTAAWNDLIPPLRQQALNAQFIGPVNFQFNNDYLASFLRQARPRPDLISWHEYTCDVSHPKSECLAQIGNWTGHIQKARATMQHILNTTLPIMITEWNYSPNATANDGKSSDYNFMSTWTREALETLAANRVFASMQYACTETSLPLLDRNNELTTQGKMLQAQYQRLIVEKWPLAIAAKSSSPPQVTTTTQPAGTPVFSFEDGSRSGWTGYGPSISQLQNSSALAKAGTHSLKLSLSSLQSGDFPYLAVSLKPGDSFPRGNQELSAYVYLPSNAVSVQARLFVTDAHDRWSTGTPVALLPGIWNRLRFRLPASITARPNQLGLQFNSQQGTTIPTVLYVDAVGWS